MAVSTALPVSAWWLLRAGSRTWRLSADSIVEILPWPRLTPVPLAPDALLGITRRGEVILPVIDPVVAGALDSASAKWVVVVRSRVDGSEVVFGLAADEVVPGDANTGEPLDVSRILGGLSAPGDRRFRTS